MSANAPPNAGGSSAAAKTKAPSKSNSDWLGPSLLAAKAIAAGGEMLPFPYVKGVFEIAVTVLETVEKVKKNREDLKELCEDTVEIIKIVQGQISAHEIPPLCLQDILNVIEPSQKDRHGLRSGVQEIVKLGSNAKQIAGYQKRIQTLRSNFMVHKLTTTVMGSNVAVSQVIQSINNCPPPSRLFRGRSIILRKMHRYFNKDLGKQHIFLLHGLGGIGKTQIALKFIQESSWFSDIFMVDASTADTIDTDLKSIAVTKNAGDVPQDALRWLSSQHDDWLIFFDNADDPKINLNSYFPRCSHGNILITSRNPGLRVHASSHSLVSDMEETDAIDLLLASAVQKMTPKNKEKAAEIVKALWYLPLAIIQAGAFIAKSGALNTYLALYTQNRARLLSEKSSQSHDDYAWTVYTTWEISFKQLSPLAAKLLQLCSFLHHQGISEKVFSGAAKYRVEVSHGILHKIFRSKKRTLHPSGKELQQSLEFLSQFLGPTDKWDSFHFMDVTNELRAYSLISFDVESGTFSIHPLVHSWSQSTLTDQRDYHSSMMAIMGMSIAIMTHDYLQLASLWLLPHVDALLQGRNQTRPNFNYQYGAVYYYSGRQQRAVDLHTVLLMKERKILGEDHLDTLSTAVHLAVTYKELGQFKEAKKLEVMVLKKQRTILGEDHPNTLQIMGNLANTYKDLGRFKEAQQLEVVVLEKRRKILGEDHPETLRAMGNLASTYHALGQPKEAEELEVVVLEKRRKVLGSDHPDTLWTMGNLATTYSKLGKLKEAEDLEVVVLEKRSKILGEDHPETLKTMGNLAVTYKKLGQLKKAEELEIVVLHKRRKMLGDGHPSTLRTMKRLQETYQRLGKLQESESLRILIGKIEDKED
ncbi:hypothetical protein DFH07DRAFT_770052 [Mycena maculata]|uniref:DUF7779 domain-containing protein n=1 Tax=Mycena maculata TaxID=230809 RepID=A0AAD7NKT0_9AGAR|nr:hypothetical protein DFH07DRAFT_770052 [Mycena maculata]